MAPTPTKRTTRSVKANQSRKAAAKRKDASLDSGYGGSDGKSPTPSIPDRDDSALPQRQRPRVGCVLYSRQPPQPTKQQPGPGIDQKTVRKLSEVMGPMMHRRLSLAHPDEDDNGALPSPVDRQILAETLATIPRSDSESHVRPPPAINTPNPDDDETAEALRYFVIPENRTDQQAIQLFFQSLQQKHPQTDTTYKHRYQVLKQAAWNWAKASFCVPDEASPPSPNDLNLMELATEHPELMEYINATIAAPDQGSTTTWEELLHAKRAEVAYCILGKVLEVHVFGEELFGVTPHQKKMLRMADLESFDAN
ncbi:MAG: hypothetical protein Q9207_008359, partial [Kuettlingeria erythrocarpa]